MSDVRSSVMGGSYARPADTSARIQFRRALTLTAMTLVMPGSAQLVNGNKGSAASPYACGWASSPSARCCCSSP